VALILTRALALRIEERLTPTADLASHYGAADGFARAQFGATVATRSRSGAPANKVYCFGHDDIDRLSEILTFFREGGCEPNFYLNPARFSAAVGEALAACNFTQLGFEQAMLFTEPPARTPPPPDGITIERVTTASVEDFIQVMADGFEWPVEWREAAMVGARRSFRAAAYHFLARYHGEPAGVGSLNLRNGVGGLGGGAVRPDFRGHGIHLALVWHRLRLARRLKCEWIQGGAAYGSPSFRNQSRAGLRLAYVESAWGRLR